MLGPKTNVNVKDLEDPCALDDGRGGVGTEGSDDGPALRKCVGGSEAADAKAGDHDAQRRPVRVAVSEVSRPLSGLVARVEIGHDPTTHSA